MKIYTLIRKGELHPIFCEDFLVHREINAQYYLAAVMDGCSSGQDSHFASALIGKLLVKITKDILYQNHEALEKDIYQVQKVILSRLFTELRQARNTLYLDPREMLSTLILMLYNKWQDEVLVIVLGDGFVGMNGVVREIDQDNRPDYPAYHLGEDFEQWYAAQENIFYQQAPRDVCISTDGVDTFRSYKTELPEDFNPLTFLLLDPAFSNNANMLGRKYNILDRKYGFKPGDDISIIRVRWDREA